jgi:hypothetical protein
MSMKNPRTLAGIEPATFRIVAQEKISLYPMDGRLNEPQSRYEDGRRAERVTLGFPAPNLIPITLTLS